MNYTTTSEAQCRRMQRLPEYIANARRKLAALEREAERYGMKDLLRPEGRS